MYWAIAGAVAAMLASAVFFFGRRRRRRREARMVSLVALLSEPTTFDPAILANVAGRVWKADLGDGTSEGADGFVASAEILHTIVHDGRIFMLHTIPQPYVEDVEEAAATIGDLRIRGLFEQHVAWFSCDAMGIDGSASDEEVRDLYRRIGRLVAELLDERCLLLYAPEQGAGYALNEDSETALRSDDPLQALQDTLSLPVVEVAADDPAMIAAVAQARREWPRFAAALEAKAGRNFSVKAPISGGGNTEFIWIEVTCVEGERIYGQLGNDPANLGSLKYGSKVSVPIAEINDWCYADAQGDMIGGFTVDVLLKAARRKRQG